MKISLWLLATVFVFLSAKTSMAVDGNARDYIAAPPGTNLSIVYFQYYNSDQFMVKGKDLPGKDKLEVIVPFYRFVHYMELFGLTIDPQIVIPFGKVSTKIGALGLDQEDATLGDIVLGSTFWFINKPEQQFWLGITPWLQVPTGRYDEDNFVASSVLASNRFTFVTQFGLEKGLGHGFHFSEYLEADFYSDNDEWTSSSGERVTQSKDPWFLSQMALSYDFTPATFCSVKWRYAWGGETDLVGTNQGDKQDNHRLDLGFFHWLTKTDQLMVELQKDVKVENGYESSGFWLRWVHAF